MAYLDFRVLREQLTDEVLKSLLEQFNVEAVDETEDYIIFPTCCHNLEGGSPKLFYYKRNKMFHCYTECNETFDIFELLRKMYRLRGREITIYEAINICGLDTQGAFSTRVDQSQIDLLNDIRDMQKMNDTHIVTEEDLKFKTYDKEVLRNFNFDYIGLMPWIEEGIGIEALQKFNIKYDKIHNAILIPNFDIYGNLIGIRARFFNPQDVAQGKYRPMYWHNQLYSHPTGRTFYGIYENHNNITDNHMAIIFEGEKSVLKYGTIYGCDNNISLATLGQNVTRDHIEFLRMMDVHTVILAYDSDYECGDYKRLKEVEDKYKKKAAILSPYFNTYYLMDYT